MNLDPTPLRGARLVAANVGLAAIFAVVGWINWISGIRHSVEILTWSASGLALAALILFGWRLWPGVLIGTFIVGLVRGVAPLLSLAIGFAAAIEAVFGAVVLVRFLDLRPSLDRLRDVIALLLVGGGVGALLGATLGVAAFWFADGLGNQRFAHGLAVWWRADFTRVVAATPLLLLMFRGSPAWSVLFANKEFWGVAALLAATLVLAFGGVVNGEFQSLTTHLPLLLVVWAGGRLGSRGAIVVGYATMVVAILATSHGLSPFFSSDPKTSMSLVLIYCMAIGSTGPVVAAIVSQHDAAVARSRSETVERLRAERERQLLQHRERIMREVHDGVGGQLVSLLSTLQHGQASHDEIAERLRRALDDMRIMIDSLESSREGLRGQLGKLRARLDPLLRRNGLEVEWRIDPDSPLDALDPALSLNCLRIIQEAVANVIQHARARHVRVVVSPGTGDTSQLSIEVIDDGIGGDPAATRPGQGMSSMLDRAREIGGEVRVESADPGRRVRLLVPVLRALA